MKVDHVERQQNIEPGTNRSKGNNSVDGGGFQELLQIEMKTGSPASAEPDHLSEFGPSRIDSPLLYGALPVSSADRQACDSVEAGLEDMEMLVKALGDERVSPKTVDRIVQGLRGSVEGMQGALGELQADHPLRMIADELNVLSYVESVKWRRGDYI